MGSDDFLRALPLPPEAREALTGWTYRGRRRNDGFARQQTASRRPFPPVGPALNHPTHVVEARDLAEHERRNIRRLRADDRQITLRPAQLAFVAACWKHPVSVGLNSLPRARREQLRAWLRKMGRTPHSHRARCLITLTCVLQHFGVVLDGRRVVAGLGLWHLASLLPSDRTANAHVGRGAVGARYHRIDRPRLTCGTGDPSSGNCGFLHELRLAGLVLELFQPSPWGAPRWAKGPSGFCLVVVVMTPDHPPD